jgi:GNAT superfamily N-acetyltransferase
MTAVAQIRGGNLTFEVSPPGSIASVIQEVKDLFGPHWDEVAVHKDVRPIDIDMPFYERMSTIGQLVTILARRNGQPIGYLAYFIRTHPHYRTWKMAVSDLFFVLPEYRGMQVARGLFRTAEEHLRTLGVRSVYNATKVHRDVGSLMKYLGYVPHEVVYEKVL